MVADDFGLRARFCLQLVRHLLVQLGSQLLGHGLVGGVSDEGVDESKPVLSSDRWPVRPDELLVHQRGEVCSDIRPVGVLQHLGEAVAVKAAALDRCNAQQAALGRRQPLNACG